MSPAVAAKERMHYPTLVAESQSGPWRRQAGRGTRQLPLLGLVRFDSEVVGEVVAKYAALSASAHMNARAGDLEEQFARTIPAAARVTHLVGIDDPDADLRLLAFADEYDPVAERSFWQALTAFERGRGIEASAFYGVWTDEVAHSLAGAHRSLI